MRTAGAAYTALAESFGASAVSVLIGDAYSGMQRGSLDCVLVDQTNLISASLNEVTTNVTMPGLGLVPGVNWGYNKKFWNGLTDEQRALLKEEMALAMVRTQAEFSANELEASKSAAEHKINVTTPDADLAQHIADFKAQFISKLIADSKDKFQADPQAIYDEYAALQEKWSKLLEGVDRTDEAAVLAVINGQDLMGKL